MGFFSRFSSSNDFPTLGPGNPAAEQLANIQGSLEALIKQIPDKLEVIPDDDSAFVFIGKPPKKFGVAWIEDGEIKNLQTLAKEKGMQPGALQSISEELQAAYEKNQDAERFSTVIAGKTIVVTPCDQLKDAVSNIISKVSH